MIGWIRSLFARRRRPEVRESDAVAKLVQVLQGQREFRFVDGTRCDIATRDLVIEVDHASKWYEGIGQLLHYHRCSGKAGLLVLLWESDEDKADIGSAHGVISLLRSHGIPVFFLDVYFRDGVPTLPDELEEAGDVEPDEGE